jgi:hypothetical protein
VGGEEPLRLPRRLEALHPAFSAAGGPVGVLGPVVEVATGSVPHIGQEIAMRHPVAAQAIGDDLPGPVLQAGEQALEESLRRRGVSAILDQDVEDHTVLIHRAPQILQLTIDPQVHLIHVPGVAWLRPTPAQLLGEVGPEPAAPAPDALLADRDTPLGQDQLNIPQAEAEYMIRATLHG